MRWFKARPSRPFGAAYFLDRQRLQWNADNWSFSEAREVIPQPQLQPITSKETRRCQQTVQLGRAPRKPLHFWAILFLTRFKKKKKNWMRLSPVLFSFWKTACLLFKPFGLRNMQLKLTPQTVLERLSFPSFFVFPRKEKKRTGWVLRGLSQQQINFRDSALLRMAQYECCQCDFSSRIFKKKRQARK